MCPLPLLHRLLVLDVQQCRLERRTPAAVHDLLHFLCFPLSLPQVERVTRESNFYPPERVKTFLMEVCAEPRGCV